jgi:hypothetical protein
MTGKTIAVWFSCGAASAVAAKLTIQMYGADNTILIVNNPVDEEDSDNRRFLKDVEQWLGINIIEATNTKAGTTSAEAIWEKRKYMSGIKGAPCTVALKKEARQEFERNNHIDYHVLGFTLEEKNRHDRFVKYERSNVIPVLIDAGISKQECFDVIRSAGIALPRAYDLGYPNANCIGCVKATSATYWAHVRRVSPEVFERRAEQSRRLGVRLVRYKGKRIFLDELPMKAFGNKMKSYECGIFCETPNFSRTPF